MIPRLSAPWRIASVVVVVGLLGSVIVTLSLLDPARPQADRPAGSGLPLGVRAGSSAVAGSAPAIRAGTRRATIGQPASVSAGLRLLREAAKACQNVSYHGIQMVAWWGGSGATTSVIEVWHQPGRGTLAQPADNVAGRGDPLEPGLSSDDSAADILSISGQLLSLLQANYQIVYVGSGNADNRPARIVEVRRPTGAVAARFWLDAATSLPLRRELFDSSARVISEDAFINLSVGAGGVASMPAAAASPWTGKLTGTQMSVLRARSWPLPSRLPDNLTLFAAQETTSASGEVVDMSYSDGLSVISLFIQQGDLPRSMPGWHRVTVQDRSLYSADTNDRSLAWSARGFEFTLIASAPPATVGQVVAALPRSQKPGFWPRLGRGFHRIASWANPFG